MIFILGWLVIGCMSNFIILLHDYLVTRNKNIASYNKAYGITKINILAMIVNIVLWPVSVVSIILYRTNSSAREFYNKAIDEMYSQDKHIF